MATAATQRRQVECHGSEARKLRKRGDAARLLWPTQRRGRDTWRVTRATIKKIRRAAGALRARERVPLRDDARPGLHPLQHLRPRGLAGVLVVPRETAAADALPDASVAAPHTPRRSRRRSAARRSETYSHLSEVLKSYKCRDRVRRPCSSYPKATRVPCPGNLNAALAPKWSVRHGMAQACTREHSGSDNRESAKPTAPVAAEPSPIAARNPAH